MDGYGGRRRSGAIQWVDAARALSRIGPAVALILLLVGTPTRPAGAGTADPASDIQCPGAQPGQPGFAAQASVPVFDTEGRERGTLLTCTYAHQGATLEVLVPADHSHCPADPTAAVTTDGVAGVDHARTQLIAEIERICGLSGSALGAVAAVVAACGLLFGVGLVAARWRRPQPPAPDPATPRPDPRQVAAHQRSLRRDRMELQTQLAATAAAARHQGEVARLMARRAADPGADPLQAAEMALAGLLATQQGVGAAVQRLTRRQRPLAQAQPVSLTRSDLVEELEAATERARHLVSVIDAAGERSRALVARIEWIDSQQRDLSTTEEAR
ncbi:MAG: hypothetical protein GY929_04085 [Actinomycetia bacterium]|nr:hypothetical protein [Actinomycetes bacterium]